jgi:hypothetical protein
MHISVLAAAVFVAADDELLCCSVPLIDNERTARWGAISGDGNLVTVLGFWSLNYGGPISCCTRWLLTSETNESVTRERGSMTINVARTGPMVLTPTREELIRALRRRHPRISDERLGKLLERRLACGTIDIFLNQTGDIDIRLTRAMRRN